MSYDDKSIRDALRELEVDFTEKEAEFIESILYEHPKASLSAQQVSWALDILDKYSE